MHALLNLSARITKSSIYFCEKYILELEILGNRNINFNEILISLQWFLIVELYRYLCYGCLKFPT